MLGIISGNRTIHQGCVFPVELLSHVEYCIDPLSDISVFDRIFPDCPMIPVSVFPEYEFALGAIDPVD